MTNLKNWLVKIIPALLVVIFITLGILSVYGYLTLHRQKLDESRHLHLEQLAQATRGLLRDNPEAILDWPDQFIQGKVLEDQYCSNLNQVLPVKDVSADYQNYLRYLPYDLKVEDTSLSYYYFVKKEDKLILGACLTEFESEIEQVIHLN